MQELGDDIDAQEKESIEKAIEDLKSALTGDDKDDIEAKTKVLTDASSKMAERVYAKSGASAEGQQAEGADAAQAETNQSTDDVVDAEFEEVKDEKQKD